MVQRTRQSLSQEFQDGERPSGQDFADIFDSFINIENDGVGIDNNGNVVLSTALQLGSTDVSAQAGLLRFNNANSQVEFNNGSIWQGLSSGGGGVFQELGTSGDVSYGGGNVGIGSFTESTPPEYRFEVSLGDNTGPTEQARFGNVVCSNGVGFFSGYAYLSHRNHTSESNYCLRQGGAGDVNINAPDGQPINILHGGNAVRLGVTRTGNVVVGSSNNLDGAEQFALQVNGGTFIRNDQNRETPFTLRVDGTACKTDGGAWSNCSDIRVKENIRDLDAGLEQLMQVRPVRFLYNGKADTIKGQAGVGIIGQEMETIFPDMVTQVPYGSEFDSDDPLRIYNGSSLTYVLVNAVKE
ncbi:MAG: tail fiber domain-containing protein, partial [Cyanobacteria bacterium P01_H01_bin.105]